MTEELTTIQISRKNQRRLKTYGGFGVTYDRAIEKLLEPYGATLDEEIKETDDVNAKYAAFIADCQEQHLEEMRQSLRDKTKAMQRSLGKDSVEG